MNKKTAIKLHPVYKVTMLIALLVFLYVIFSTIQIENLPKSRFIPSQITTLSDGWYTLDNSGTKTPLPELDSWEIYSDHPVTIHRKLPVLNNEDYLFIENNFNYIKVFIDNTCIYDYTKDSIDFPANMSGHFFCQIPLSNKDSEKIVSVEIFQPHQFFNIGISSIMIGTGSAYITNYLYSHTELIISLFFMIMASICLFLVFLWLKHKKTDYNFTVFGQLSLFSLLSTFWIFSDSQIPQLFWENPITICMLSFFSFMVLPLPMLSITSTLCHDSRHVLNRMKFFLILNVLIQGILYAFCDVSLVLMLPITHCLIAVNVIVLLIFLTRRLRGSSSHIARPLLLSLILLILSAVLSLIQFYLDPQVDNSRFFRYGFIVFISIMIYVSMKAMMSFFNEYTKHKILKKLAYTDILTNVESRLAFEEFLTEMRNRNDCFSAAIYVCDLNNLKLTNDTYGHKAGDKILEQAAGCIFKVFHNFGRVFRIGGDEFVVFLESPSENMPDFSNQLESEILRVNNTCEYPFTLSMGYAFSEMVLGDKVDALLKQADDNMYKNKMKFKESCK